MADKEEIVRQMEKLGKAVTDCLNDSDEIKSMIKHLEEAGLNLNLSFVAMVSGSKPLAFPVSWGGPSRELKFEITPEDRAFLQSLGIKYDSEAQEGKEPGEEDGISKQEEEED